MSLEFQSINICSEFNQISFEAGSLCFIGNSLDDRGSAAFQELNKLELVIKKISYDDTLFRINFDEQPYTHENFLTCFSTLSYSNVIIEATTLGFAEILFILQGTVKSPFVKSVKILYIEPKEYKFKNSSISTYDDFDLSKKLKNFPPIPSFTLHTRASDYNKIDLIAFLGFERNRLGQIFSWEDNPPFKQFTPVIPLPAFTPGWENRSLNNHLSFFTDEYSFEKIKYVSANNPYQSYSLLKQLSQSRNKFRIAPIGTKPNAIGCAIFLVNMEDDRKLDVGVLYDFPVKKQGRSTGIGKINVYNLFLTRV